MTFWDLCCEVVAWSIHNFKGQDGLYEVAPLMGVAEELLYELPIAEDHYDQEIDALADAIIFLADYCARAAVPQDTIESMDSFLFPRKTLGGDPGYWVETANTSIASGIGSVMQVALKRRQRIRNVTGHGDLLGLAIGIGLRGSILCGATFREKVIAVWDEVKQRDWIAYPETGRPPKE